MSNVIEFSIKAQDEFSAVMNKQSNMMAKLEGAFIGLGVAAAVYGAVKLAQASLDNAEAMGIAANAANITTESFSALAWAAKNSDLETSQLEVGLRQLNKAIAEGESSPAGLALQNIGVQARTASGELRPTIDVLFDVADAFAIAGSDANKTKVSLDIFGKAGKDMVPFLNMGREGIQALMEDAKSLGMVIGDDFAKSANQINDNMANIAGVANGAMNVAMQNLAPTIELVTNEIIDFLKEGDNIQAMGDVITVVFKSVLTAGTAVAAIFKQLGMIIAAVAAAVVSAATGEFSRAGQIFKDLNADLLTESSKTKDKIIGYWDGSAAAAAASSRESATAARKLVESLHVISKAEEDARKEHEKLIKTISDADAAMYASIATTGMSAEMTKLYELRQKGATEAELGRLPVLAALKEAMAANDKAFAEATSIIDGQTTPLEKHEQMLKSINDLRRDGIITLEQHAQMIERETLAWNVAKQSTDEYKWGVSSAMDVAGAQITMHLKSLGNVSYQIGSLITNVFNTVVKGLGDAVADAVLDGKSLADSLTNLSKVVLKTIISTLVQIGVQRALLSTGIITAYAAEAGASTASAGVMVAGGTAVSIAWGPIALIALAIIAALYILKEAMEKFGPIGVAVGLAVSTAFLPIATIAAAIIAAIYLINEALKFLKDAFEGDVPIILIALAPLLVFFKILKDAVDAVMHAIDAVASGVGGISIPGVSGVSSLPGANAVSGASDAVSHAGDVVSDLISFDGGGFTGEGARAGGLDGKGGFMALLHPNETITDHTLLQDQTSSSGGSTVIIQSLEVHVMENATNAGVFATMDKIQLRNALGKPVVDALNEMFAIGVRPNYASQKV